MATKAEVRDRAANDLGILRLNQSLQSQDVTRIESAYDEVYESLKKDGLASWASTAAVPTQLVPHVVDLVALNCNSTYGISGPRYDRIIQRAGGSENGNSPGYKAKKEIRKLVGPDYVSQDSPTDY